LTLPESFTYFLILAGSIAGPLFLSFDKKVAFFSKRKAFFFSLILPALFYIVWDMIFTKMGIWSFNPRFVTGNYIYNLPIEEVLFFLIVPYCCLFIYECIKCYLPQLNDNPKIKIAFRVFGIALLLLSFFFYQQAYSFYTFLFTGCFITILYLIPAWNKRFNTTAFLLSYFISLIPFLIVNGMLTSFPVVIYNHQQNMDLRIGTIPVEDTIYGMLLMLWCAVGFESKLGKR
jgi:lycopene cyclase domain-containing protein